MPLTRRHIALLLALLVLAAGCRSHREAARTPQPPAVEEAPIEEEAPARHYYTANFTITSQGYKANGQLRLQPDSIIWASASKVIELGRAKLTPDSVVVYAKILNRCFRGTYEDVYRRYRYRTSFDELYQMVTAEDAGAQIAALMARMGIEAALQLGPMKEVGQLAFPMYIPDNVNPL